MAGHRPRFSFTAGSLSADTDSPVGGPVRFVVERSVAVPIDSLRVMLAESAGVAAGDAVTLDLGDEDGLQRVFTGTVAELRPSLSGCSLFSTGTMLGLVELRVASFYEGRSAGDVVRDLVGQAGLDAGDISDGLTLPRYAIERRQGAHTQLRRLAERLGFALFADRQGQVHFRGLGPAAQLGSGGLGGGLGGAASGALAGAAAALGGSGDLAFGKHLLAAQALLRPAPNRKIVVGGESPMSGQGEDKSFWLTATDSDFEDSSGSGDEWLITDAAARTKDMAGRFAAGYAAALAARSAELRLTVLGMPALDLGDDLGASDAPEAGLNARGVITGLRHRLSAREGFVTDLVIAAEPAA